MSRTWKRCILKSLISAALPGSTPGDICGNGAGFVDIDPVRVSPTSDMVLKQQHRTGEVATNDTKIG